MVLNDQEKSERSTVENVKIVNPMNGSKRLQTALTFTFQKRNIDFRKETQVHLFYLFIY
jgi:hypothetical protein